jgi:hypothetical protein
VEHQEATVTIQDDPNSNMRRRPGYREDEITYAGWAIGGVVALVLLFGAIMLFGRDNRSPITASNTNTPAATTTVPSTTGSGRAGTFGRN